MPNINIVIVSVMDPPPFENIKPLMTGVVSDVVILEAGMQSGETSVYLIGTDKDGKKYSMEISLKSLERVTLVAHGADDRFKNSKHYGKN